MNIYSRYQLFIYYIYSKSLPFLVYFFNRQTERQDRHKRSQQGLQSSPPSLRQPRHRYTRARLVCSGRPQTSTRALAGPGASALRRHMAPRLPGMVHLFLCLPDDQKYMNIIALPSIYFRICAYYILC